MSFLFKKQESYLEREKKIAEALWPEKNVKRGEEIANILDAIDFASSELSTTLPKEEFDRMCVQRNRIADDLRQSSILMLRQNYELIDAEICDFAERWAEAVKKGDGDTAKAAMQAVIIAVKSCRIDPPDGEDAEKAMRKREVFLGRISQYVFLADEISLIRDKLSSASRWSDKLSAELAKIEEGTNKWTRYADLLRREHSYINDLKPLLKYCTNQMYMLELELSKTSVDHIHFEDLRSRIVERDKEADRELRRIHADVGRHSYIPEDVSVQNTKFIDYLRRNMKEYQVREEQVNAVLKQLEEHPKDV